MDPSKRLIEKIREQEISPKPKWFFFLRNRLVLSGFLLFILLGGISFSIVLLVLQQADFQLLEHFGHSRWESVLSLLPFLWLVLLVVALGLAMWSLRRIKRGYKFPLGQLAGYSVALSMVIGTLFFISGGGKALEDAFAIQVSFYEGIREKKEKLWTMPEEGYLSGKIEKTEIGSLELRAFNGTLWEVDVSEASFPPFVLLERGEEIKLIGELMGDHQFRAREIRPWGGPGSGSRFRNQGRKKEGN